MRLNSKRTNCILDNSKLKLIYTFKKFPIFIGATKQGILKDKFVDMEIGISQKDFKPLIIAIVGQYKKEIKSQIKSLNKSAKIIN